MVGQPSEEHVYQHYNHEVVENDIEEKDSICLGKKALKVDVLLSKISGFKEIADFGQELQFDYLVQNHQDVDQDRHQALQRTTFQAVEAKDELGPSLALGVNAAVFNFFWVRVEQLILFILLLICFIVC